MSCHCISAANSAKTVPASNERPSCGLDTTLFNRSAKPVLIHHVYPSMPIPLQLRPRIAHLFPITKPLAAYSSKLSIETSTGTALKNSIRSSSSAGVVAGVSWPSKAAEEADPSCCSKGRLPPAEPSWPTVGEQERQTSLYQRICRCCNRPLRTRHRDCAPASGCCGWQ